MKTKLQLSIILLCLPFLAYAQNVDELRELFLNPTQEARTKLWWFHGETVTTREGIDADLRAFRDAGIGGVVFYDQCHGSQQGACASMSAEWWETLKYAATRAKEFGLSFEIASTNGYVAGGPWITPELGMQKVVTLRPGDKRPEGFKFLTKVSLPNPDRQFFVDSLVLAEKIRLSDDEPFELTIDFGQEKEVRTLSYTVSPRGKGSYGSMNVPGMPQKEYFGAMYVAKPPIGDLECSDDGRQWKKVVRMRGIENVIGHKSRQRTLNFSPVKARYFRIHVHDWLGPDRKSNRLELESVRLMSYDLTDNWEEKTGLRSEVPFYDDSHVSATSPRPFFGELTIGYAPTGGATKHGRKRIVWEGREISGNGRLEADVMNAEAAELHYRSYFKAIHDTLRAIGCKPQGMHIDSHEAGIANWTPRLPEHFRRLCGYDMSPWLPALAGIIVGSREETERFLADFRRTIAVLVREQFYGTFDALCRRDSVALTSQAMLGCINDNIASRGAVSKPQGEFWAYQKDGGYDVLDAASAAHLYGKRIASAEAFTDSPYTSGWSELLRIANLAYTKGINEFVVCASSYQPWMDRKYDDSASAHPYVFHRHNSLWSDSREQFWEYQARCSQLLRMGRPVVDCLVYIGEQLPAKTLAYKLPEIPAGITFDVCTLPSLKAWSKRETDSDYCPRYKTVIVQGRSEISAEAEELFQLLEARGMRVIRCDKGESVSDVMRSKWFELANCHDSRNLSDKSDSSVITDYSRFANVAERIHHCHRETSGADIHLFYNHSQNPRSIKLSAAIRGAEVWHPLTAETRELNDPSLMLEPFQALFLISRR